MKIHRQGDVGLMLLPGEPGKEETNHRNWGVNKADGVLAKGTATGHSHRMKGDFTHLTGPNVKGEGLVHIGKGGAVLAHEEHETLTHLLPGEWYRVIRQKEFSREEIRRVRD
jgi:hypothetical protein